jgi:hypothetical protein
MAELQFSWNDVSELTRRLSLIAHELSESEWALLLAIFATSADRVESGPVKGQGTLPAAEISDAPHEIASPRSEHSAQLRDQLLRAYVPGSPPSVSWSIKITPPPTPVHHTPESDDS